MRASDGKFAPAADASSLEAYFGHSDERYEKIISELEMEGVKDKGRLLERLQEIETRIGRGSHGDRPRQIYIHLVASRPERLTEK